MVENYLSLMYDLQIIQINTENIVVGFLKLQ